MTEGYVELHAASAFSFLEGASQPESLIERAVELEMPAMALLDRNGVYGSARFHTSAKRNKIQAHIGAEVGVSSLGQRLTPRMVATSVQRRTSAIAASLRIPRRLSKSLSAYYAVQNA
jgi:DNA polymerase III alpha subunit